MALEASRMGRHWLPWHPDVAEGEGEEDCEDPDRLVLFDDIKQFIRPFSDAQHQLFILITYLRLLGVEVDYALPTTALPFIKTTSYLTSTTVLIDDNYLQGFNKSPFDAPLQVKVINNLFEQTRSRFHGAEKRELTKLWLTWKLQEFNLHKDLGKKERKAKVKELKSFAKQVLGEEENRNDLRLWEVYVELLWSLQEEGDKVMTGVLSNARLDLRAGHVIYNSCMAARLYRLQALRLLGLHSSQVRPFFFSKVS